LSPSCKGDRSAASAQLESSFKEYNVYRSVRTSRLTEIKAAAEKIKREFATSVLKSKSTSTRLPGAE
jgi:hypothetical protein